MRFPTTYIMTSVVINKVEQIHQVRYILYGEPLSKLSSIPFTFLYNCSWKIEHECCSCMQPISFGLHYNSSESQWPKVSYQQLKYLCSKYYKDDFLKLFPLLFSSTELREWKGKLFVISDNIFDSDFPVTSSIEPIVYNCPACKADYVARIRIGPPLEPERDMPQGRVGKIFIDEIVQVKVDEDKHLLELAEENKI